MFAFPYQGYKEDKDKDLFIGQQQIVTSLAKEVMFLVALVSLFVCLFVCLSVDNITQKVMNELGWNFMDGSWVLQGRTD